MIRSTRVEFGDFQTPPDLAREVCGLLERLNIRPDAVVEPTCGKGAFLLAASHAFPAAGLWGWDVHAGYLNSASLALEAIGARGRARLEVQDFFVCDWDSRLREIPGDLLVLGNPPWVTNAALTRISGSNLPLKHNFLGYKGLAARTGKSNFDISEWILMRLLAALGGRVSTVAMLCKASAARKALQFGWANGGKIAYASLYKIDSKRCFSASVDACLLVMRLGSEGPAEASVFDHFDSEELASIIGMAAGRWISDMSAYKRFRPPNPGDPAGLESCRPHALTRRAPVITTTRPEIGLGSDNPELRWRSGIKHDCAPIMVLQRAGQEGWINGLGQPCELESDRVYPLLKATDLARGRLNPSRFVLMTQRRVNEDTSALEITAPHVWRYLSGHRARFDARKSRIYRGRPPYSLFGIGDYCFAPWKVAVSGMHLPAQFRLIGPADSRPVMFDDTCYYLPFWDADRARKAVEWLNLSECQEFLGTLVFKGAKRPITTEVLSQLELEGPTPERNSA